MRRPLLSLVLGLLTAGLMAAPIQASAFPDRLDLPDGFAPEGIASGRGTTFYAGSLSGAGIWRGDLRTGEGVIEPGDFTVDEKTHQVFLTEDISSLDPECEQEICSTLRSDIENTDDVVSVHVTGRHLDKLPARAGQFCVWRFPGHFGLLQANPFSLSAAPGGRLSLRLTAKAVGTTSAGLRTLPVGSRVFVEGPYGAFTPRGNSKVTM